MILTMRTDNGPHPPEKWAVTTASHIMPVTDEMAGTHLIAAHKLQFQISEILVPYHQGVFDHEVNELKSRGGARLFEPIHTNQDFVDEVLDKIVQAAKGTPWEKNFSNPEMQDNVRQTLNSHFNTVRHIHRSLHADRNMHLEEARAFKALHHPGEPPAQVESNPEAADDANAQGADPNQAPLNTSLPVEVSGRDVPPPPPVNQ